MPLFIASLYGVYFTPLFDALMGNPIGHQLMLAHFVVTGLLFFGPIVGQDPWPRTLSHPGRMLELFLPVPFHAFFGVAIMMAGSLVVETFAQPPSGWGIDPLADQGVAGGIVWAFGELPTVLVLAVVFFSWASSDDRRAKALDRAADRTGDAELEAYNARLRAMAMTSSSSRTTPRQEPSPTPVSAVTWTGREASGPRARSTNDSLPHVDDGVGVGGQVLLGRLDQHRGDDRAEHQERGRPGEGGRVALDLRLQADGRVARRCRPRPPCRRSSW